MIKYVDAMQKSKSVAREWRQSDYFAIFVWVSKQFASAAGEIINFLVFLAKRLLLMVNIQFDGTANIVWKMSQKMFSLPKAPNWKWRDVLKFSAGIQLLQSLFSVPLLLLHIYLLAVTNLHSLFNHFVI